MLCMHRRGSPLLHPALPAASPQGSAAAPRAGDASTALGRQQPFLQVRLIHRLEQLLGSAGEGTALLWSGSIPSVN